MATATKATHSPGPWMEAMDRDGTPCVRDATGWMVCKSAHFELEKDAANRALIAAAPDLLAACEATVDFLSKFHYPSANDTELRELLRFALAKATA